LRGSKKRGNSVSNMARYDMHLTSLCQRKTASKVKKCSLIMPFVKPKSILRSSKI
jgi:hypothetical protein